MAKKKEKATCPSESTEQKAFVAYCNVMGIRVASVPNGVFLDSDNRFAIINKLKGEGMLPGFPDLIILAKNKRGDKIFFLEMKKQEGGELSVEQKEMIEFLDGMGHCVGVANGADHAIELLNIYLELD